MGAGALASAFGKDKKQVASENKTGYQALPKEIQDLLIQQYLPKAQSTLNMPYQNIPMQRYEGNPQTDPFASQGLADLQKFSDAAGGYFSPYSGGANGQVNAASYQGAAGSGSAQPMQAPTNNGEVGSGNDLATANMWLDNYAGGGKAGETALMAKQLLQSGKLSPSDIIGVINNPKPPSHYLSTSLLDLIRNAGHTGAQLSDPSMAMNLLRGGGGGGTNPSGNSPFNFNKNLTPEQLKMLKTMM